MTNIMEEQVLKRIRSASPDVIVAVGTGDNAEEFKCYRIALAHACPYFDAMLSTNMTENNEGRIEFPNKDPDEWKIFYPFIDPFQIGEAKHASINDENVMTLVPWFHEFQMNSLYRQCDQFLSDKVLSLARAEKVCDYGGSSWGLKLDISFWDRSTNNNPHNNSLRRGTFREIVKLLEFSCIYDLTKTKINAEGIISKFLGCLPKPSTVRLLHGNLNMIGKTYDLFTPVTVKILTTLFLPLSEEEGTYEDGDDYKYIESNGKSTELWVILRDAGFEYELDGLSLEEINTSSLLPVLVKTFIERCGLLCLSHGRLE